MTPQIIYIILFSASLVLAGYQHGKPKKGNHNMYLSIIASIAAVSLLYWGGFFDCFFK